MPNRVLVGPTNNGKSIIVGEFRRLLPLSSPGSTARLDCEW
jgi:hypothetical protein